MTRRPADSRGTTHIGWLHSRHSFSFGRYHDPANMGYRALRVLNDDIVAPGAGFGEHSHDNMEILTWVLDGVLKHGDSLGNMQELRHGALQVMSAGAGITHRELNGSDTEPVHFLQMWIEPAKPNIEPRYLQETFDPAGRKNQWQPLASGHSTHGALPIEQDAEIRITDLDAGQTLTAEVPSGRHAYLHLATGEATINNHPLQPGDAITVAGPAELTIHTTTNAEILWFDLA